MKTATWASVRYDGRLVEGTVLESREDVAVFHKDHPYHEIDMKWKYPECHNINDELHHSRSTKCSFCGKFWFGNLPLPLNSDRKEIFRRAFLRDKIASFEEQIKEAKYRISCLEEEISEQEGTIKFLDEEKEKYKTAIGMIK